MGKLRFFAGYAKKGRSRSTPTRAATQPLGHDPHDLDREKRSLLDQDAKALQIDHSEFTGCAGNSRGTAGPIIEQRQLSKNATLTDRFEHPAAQNNLHLPFHDRVHHITRLSLGENRLSHLKGPDLPFAFEKIYRRHWLFPSGASAAVKTRIRFYTHHESFPPVTIV
jgi:hypothetical protein